MNDAIDRYTRVRWLLGEDFKKLRAAKILICGAGGVGGICADALARSGVGEITLVDKDVFDVTNQNRQIYSEAVGAVKVGEFAARYENVDAIDDMPAKIALALAAPDKIIVSMGGAKRIDASQVRVESVWKTHGDPFARKYRSELKRAGFKGDFSAVFSTEPPRCKPLGSFMGVTAVFGLNLASLAVRKILQA